MVDRRPPLLTVEEAARLLRVGRTKAYAMAQEWRDTDGRSGLPVVDLGHVLRVPLARLEELIGADLAVDAGPDGPDHPVVGGEPRASAVTPPVTEAAGRPLTTQPAPTRRTRRRGQPTNQLTLFNPPAQRPRTEPPPS